MTTETKAPKKKREKNSNSPFAVIRAGNRQYRITNGDVIDIDLVPQNKGEKVTLTDVLFSHDGNHAKVGAPLLKGAVVEAEVVDHLRGPKVINYKYKRRKNYRRKVGHRQSYTRIKITNLSI